MTDSLHSLEAASDRCQIHDHDSGEAGRHGCLASDPAHQHFIDPSDQNEIPYRFQGGISREVWAKADKRSGVSRRGHSWSTCRIGIPCRRCTPLVVSVM